MYLFEHKYKIYSHNFHFAPYVIQNMHNVLCYDTKKKSQTVLSDLISLVLIHFIVKSWPVKIWPVKIWGPSLMHWVPLYRHCPSNNKFVPERNNKYQITHQIWLDS